MKNVNPLRVDNITDYSQRLKDKFLEYYAEGSQRQCVNAIRQLVRITGKSDFSLLVYSDLENYEKEYPRGQGSNFSLVENFFKYLYCYNYLTDLVGFEKSFWNKELLQSNLENQKNRISNPPETKPYSPRLKFEDIEKLIAFCDNVSDDDIDNLKLAFCFEMLFYEDMSVNTLRDLDSSNYILPKKYEKYRNLFSVMGTYTNSKFSRVTTYIKNLGKKLDISNNLIPGDIQAAHKNSLFMCPVCGHKYLSFAIEWRTLNGRILCVSCYEKMLSSENIKKNIIQNEIEGTIVDVISFNDKKVIEYETNSYEKLLDKIAKPTNFENLHEYLSEIGRLGEKYVYESEKKRLLELGSEYSEWVDATPAKDHRNGYDILSFNEKGEEIYIEVKATKSGDIFEPFFITQNERDKAKEVKATGGMYQIHRVLNVFDKELVCSIVYGDIENGSFCFEEVLYKVTPLK